jgi:hypothetical protein
VALCDGEQALARQAEGEITGFDLLYDYVHFTPAGAERLAEELDRTLVDAKVIDAWPEGASFAPKRLAALDAATRDSLDVREWLGWQTDKAFLKDRDIWKLERALEKLDEKIASGAATAEELVWAGDADALHVGFEARARERWAKAKLTDAKVAALVDANLAWLDARAK